MIKERLICNCSISEPLLVGGTTTTGSDILYIVEGDKRNASFENSEQKGYSVMKRGDTNIYICQMGNCNRCFGSRQNVVRHIKTHTGEKPFKCSFCDHRSSRKDHLKSHEMKQHKLEKFLHVIP